MSKHLQNLLRFSFCKNDIFTISVAVSDNSDDLHLINIFVKSTKAERFTDVMFKLTLSCLSVTVEDLDLSEYIDMKM